MVATSHGNCTNGTCQACKDEQLALHHQAFPACTTLTLHPARHRLGAFHNMYDSEELRVELGPQRFDALLKTVKALYSVGHVDHQGEKRVYPVTHPDPNWHGSEVLCISAQDLNQFLQGGG
ncbi:MAG TPA: hypothetical protein VKY85_01270 [Candidatus Angelobacter sp.]|nr:hypothetical protein [Candidatus Angelobacter sp.]